MVFPLPKFFQLLGPRLILSKHNNIRTSDSPHIILLDSAASLLLLHGPKAHLGRPYEQCSDNLSRANRPGLTTARCGLPSGDSNSQMETAKLNETPRVEATELRSPAYHCTEFSLNPRSLTPQLTNQLTDQVAGGGGIYNPQ